MSYPIGVSKKFDAFLTIQTINLIEKSCMNTGQKNQYLIYEVSDQY